MFAFNTVTIVQKFSRSSYLPTLLFSCLTLGKKPEASQQRLEFLVHSPTVHQSQVSLILFQTSLNST